MFPNKSVIFYKVVGEITNSARIYRLNSFVYTQIQRRNNVATIVLALLQPQPIKFSGFGQDWLGDVCDPSDDSNRLGMVCRSNRFQNLLQRKISLCHKLKCNWFLQKHVALAGCVVFRKKTKSTDSQKVSWEGFSISVNCKPLAGTCLGLVEVESCIFTCLTEFAECFTF